MSGRIRRCVADVSLIMVGRLKKKWRGEMTVEEGWSVRGRGMGVGEEGGCEKRGAYVVKVGLVEGDDRDWSMRVYFAVCRACG
jgi:hypothetical protein